MVLDGGMVSNPPFYDADLGEPDHGLRKTVAKGFHVDGVVRSAAQLIDKSIFHFA